MYLNYANQNTSKASLFLLGFFSLIFILFIVIQCFYLEFFDTGLFFMQGAFAAGFIAVFLFRLCTYITEMQKLKSSFYIKKVTFLPDSIDFKFFQPQYDIICDYTQIEKMELIITTDIINTKNGKRHIVSELTVNFTILNNKTITIKNVPMNYMGVIYSLIDVGKKVKDFAWSFDGVGEISDIVEKITDYSEKNLKQILAKGEEDNMKIMSVIFFVLGIIILYPAKDSIDLIHLESYISVLIIPMGLIISSFIFDVILLMDKIREENHKLL